MKTIVTIAIPSTALLSCGAASLGHPEEADGLRAPGHVSAEPPTFEVVATDDQVVGRWFDDSQFVGGPITIRQTSAGYQLEQVFPGESRRTLKLVEREDAWDRRFDDPSSDYGEYYLIDGNGRLAIYDRQGLIKNVRRVTD